MPSQKDLLPGFPGPVWIHTLSKLAQGPEKETLSSTHHMMTKEPSHEGMDSSVLCASVRTQSFES